MNSSSWKLVSPEFARALTDARLQLHHAAQLATAFGISYLPARGDDSHTNLEWLPDAGALASNALRDVRVCVRVADLTLLVGGKELGLHDKTVSQAAAWIREQLAAAELDAARYTLKRHYEIPAHPVASGKPFTADARRLEQLAAWFSNGAAQFEQLRANNSKASEVRCWPHHFDIATLITVAPGKTVGVGLEPGDVYYDEPYFYVNLHPSPTPDSLPNTLKGGGRWHTHEWIGAVLPGSRLASGAKAQATQVAEFLESAVTQATELLREA